VREENLRLNKKKLQYLGNTFCISSNKTVDIKFSAHDAFME